MLTPERKAELRRAWETCPGGKFIELSGEDEFGYLAELAEQGVEPASKIDGRKDECSFLVIGGKRRAPLDWMAM